MDLRALRYFIEVVRQNGFTRAAETLHVTQPTISKMVKALEDEFGIEIPDEEAEKITNVQHAIDYAKAHHKA